MALSLKKGGVAMVNVNTVLIAGNITRDIKTNETKSGAKVANFTVAINRKYKTKEQKLVEEVTFVDVETWAQQSETVSKYCKKGDPILVEGRLKLNTWEAEGQKRSRLVVVAERVQFLGGKKNGADSPAKPSEDVPF